MKTSNHRSAAVFTFVSLVCLLLSAKAFGDEEAITTTGNRIIIRDDGTWIPAADRLESNMGFRNTKWGMSLAEVQTAEGTKKQDVILTNEKGFAVKQNVAGLSCNTYYIFAVQKLVRAKYAFLVEHSNETDFITVDYPKVKKLLTDKYGKPAQDRQYWKNELYKDEPAEWGMALQVGHLVYFTNWETDNTSILLYLSGENYKIDFGVEYTSLFLRGLEQDEDSRKAKTDF